MSREPASTQRIAEELWPFVVPIDSLRAHPDNPHVGDRGEIAKSLRRFGQVRPILALRAGPENALPDSTIIAGHHVWLSAGDEGWTEVAAIRIPMSDDEAKSYLIADNRLNQIGQEEDVVLARVLTELKDDELLDGTGYDEDQVDAIVKLLNEEEQEPEQPESKERECPACGHVWKP